MADVVDKATRSRMMSGIAGKNTRPELIVRSLLHRSGFRFRIHCSTLPGKPDIVLKKYRAVVFVHGCFWHQHECHLFRWPSSNGQFWKRKIRGNAKNDTAAYAALRKLGWRILIVWECAIKGRKKVPLEKLAGRAHSWLLADRQTLQIRGS